MSSDRTSFNHLILITWRAMGYPWFRFYDEVVDDPKVQLLPERLFKAWVNFMCIANKHAHLEGSLPPIEVIAYRLHVTVPRAEALLNELVTANLFEWRDGIAYSHNWQGRQFHSDCSTERVKRFRNVSRNVSETVDVTQSGNGTDTDTDTDTEADTDTDKTSSFSSTAEAVFEIYNRERGALLQCRKLNAERRKKCLARLRQNPEFLKDFTQAVIQARDSAFMTGAGERGWIADFDFFIANDTNYLRVLEGKYNGRTETSHCRIDPAVRSSIFS